MKRPSWKGKTVLITSGPTREHLDPIRFLTNASSGKMGWALAAEARRRGARTIVISGPCALTPLAGVKTVAVVTGLQMLRETLARCAAADVVIAAAAVSDWRFAEVRSRKLKRGKAALRLTLKPNPDIIKAVSRRRKALSRQVLVGFALETHRKLAFAKAKLAAKGLDLIVANGPSTLGSARARLTLVGRGWTCELPSATKAQAARGVLDAVEGRWR